MYHSLSLSRFLKGFPGGSEVKNPPAINAGGPSSIPGWGRSPGGRNGTPLQYSCLGNSIDRGAWRATQGHKRVRHDLATKQWQAFFKKKFALDSEGEGEGGMIWENGIETCILSCKNRITSLCPMQDTSSPICMYAYMYKYTHIYVYIDSTTLICNCANPDNLNM